MVSEALQKLKDEKEEIMKNVEENLKIKKEIEKKISVIEDEKNASVLNSRLEKDLIRNELNEEIEKWKEMAEKLQEE